MKTNLSLISRLLLSITLIGCVATPEKPSETAPISAAKAVSPMGKYPIHDRLEYMLHCIRNHRKSDILDNTKEWDAWKEQATQSCGCKIDEIAQKMTFAEFELAKTFGQLSKQNGDAGNAFRNPEQSKALKKRLKETEDAAEKTCFGQ